MSKQSRAAPLPGTTTPDLARRLLGFWPQPAVQAGPDSVAPTFADWWMAWIDSQAGRAALRTFDRARGPGRDALEAADAALVTLWRLARACYFAATYNRSLDPGETFRAEVRQVNREIRPALADAATVLAEGFSLRRPGLEWALDAASVRAGVGSRRKEPRPMAGMWGEFFAALAAALRDPLPELDGGPYFHRFTIGNLHFEAPKATGRPVALDTLLLFELVFSLRQWSLGRARDVRSAGQRMPGVRGARSHYGIAAAFCWATLGESVDSEQVRMRLRELPKDVGLIPWPHEL